MSNSLLFLEKTFPTQATSWERLCSAFSLWLGSPRTFPLHCSVHRILKALQGPRRPAVLSCREGEAAVVPWHPHVVMPMMTTCY